MIPQASRFPNGLPCGVSAVTGDDATEYRLAIAAILYHPRQHDHPLIAVSTRLRAPRFRQAIRALAPDKLRSFRRLISVIGNFIGSLYGFGERTALSRTNLNVLSREHGGITRPFASFLTWRRSVRQS